MTPARYIATSLLDNETARQFIHRTVGHWHGVAKAHGFSRVLVGDIRYRYGMFQKSYYTGEVAVYATLIGSNNKALISFTVLMRDKRTKKQMFLASWDIGTNTLDEVMSVFDVIMRSDNTPDVLVDMVKFLMNNHKK